MSEGTRRALGTGAVILAGYFLIGLAFLACTTPAGAASSDPATLVRYEGYVETCPLYAVRAKAPSGDYVLRGYVVRCGSQGVTSFPVTY